MRLTSMEIHGYRNLPPNPIRFGRTTLVIGPNNCGKSSLLRAVRLWSQLYGPRSTLDEVMRTHGGVELFPRSLGAQSRFGAELAATWTFTERSYHVVLEGYSVPTTRWAVVRERQERGAAWAEVTHDPPSWSASEGVTISPLPAPATGLGDAFEWTFDLQGAPGSELDLLWWLLRPERVVAMYRAPQFRNDLARAPKERTGRPVLDDEGADLPNSAKALEQGENRVPWRRFRDRVAEAIPGSELSFAEYGTSHLTLRLDTPSGTFALADVSDGTLQMLRWALLTAGRSAPILAIDEPELHLHPAWLRLIGRWLQDAPATEQVILATHSPDLLDAFTEGFRSGQVVMVVMGLDGQIRQPVAAELDRHLQAGWELGDLYRVGEPDLGGWPW